MAKYPTNKAGARLGTGYCDAQCPHDLKWINGEPNVLDWKPSKTDKNAGFGKYGTCCVEMDIWEANSMSTAYTAHSCDVDGQMRCGDDKDELGATGCGDNDKHDRFKGHCDKNGCDFATRRLGDASFFGAGSNFTLDSTKPMTVVTQFITDDNTDTGKLVDIRRFYMQNGKKFETPSLNVGSGGKHNSLSEEFCKDWAEYTQDGTNFIEKGGLASMDKAMSGAGMVLVMSLWDDHEANMLWLDSTYPTDGKQNGAHRGPCSITSGDPKDVEKNNAKSSVTFSNIRFGEIGSTTSGPMPTPPPTPPPSPPTPGRGNCCWGGATCEASTNCHYDEWCSASKEHCTGSCQGNWCPSVQVVV
jgi:cellulose 1,4-beta-cellobiosidase